MIRIDEIYCNTFLPLIQDRPYHGLHWFDPFGSVEYKDLCSIPPIADTSLAVRYLFWDQEPLNQHMVDKTLTQFVQTFEQGRRHIITSEHVSENVERVCDTYGFHAHYYFFHAWAALDWYRGYNHSNLITSFHDRKISQTFLCPNNIIGGQRQHRILLLAELVNRGIIENSIVSFPAVCPYEKKTVEDICKTLGIACPQIELPLRIDDFDQYHSNSHRIDMWNLAQKTLLHVITETAYTGRRQHLTEKTFKPIVMQQPFVMVSCQGSLEYLRRYGFRTFNDFWDESYDQCSDQDRIPRIGKLLEDLDNLSVAERSKLQVHLWATVKHNYDWFYSREFEALLWKELQDMTNEFGI